jgi:hypothetical protein
MMVAKVVALKIALPVAVTAVVIVVAKKLENKN